jgi:hypothetical protein
MKFISYIRFIFSKRRFIIIGLLAFVLLAWWVSTTNGKPVDALHPTLMEELGWWTKWADPIIGMGTFILALVIGWIQLRDDWEESLDKRLTVIFKYQEREVMLCKKAYLTAEGDIRNLGQQIGAQMNDNQHLKFRANDIESKRLGVEKNEFQNGEYFMHFQVEFELTELPKKTAFQTTNLIWHEPDNTTVKEKEAWISIVVGTEIEN